MTNIESVLTDVKNKLDKKQNGGIGFWGLLAIVFITLKLTNVIAWSWWWVLAPLWIPASITIVLIILCIIILACMK